MMALWVRPEKTRYMLPLRQVPERRAIHKLRDRVQAEELTSGGDQQLLDILSANAKTPAVNRCDYFEGRFPASGAPVSEFGQVLHTRNLIARCPVIFSKFRLDYHFGPVLIGHQEVGGLIHVLKALGNTCLVMSYVV